MCCDLHLGGQKGGWGEGGRLEGGNTVFRLGSKNNAPSARHAAAHAVEDNLEAAVKGNVAGERIVSAFVHEPATATRNDSKNQNASYNLIVKQEVEPCGMHEDDFGHAVCHVERSGIEEALADKLLLQCVKVLHQRSLSHQASRFDSLGVGSAVGDARQRLVGLGGAYVKVVVRLRRVDAVANLELDHTSPRMALLKFGHVVVLAIDQNFLLGRACLSRFGPALPHL